MKLLAPKHAGAVIDPARPLSTSRMQQLDREGKLKALRDSANRRFYREDAVLRFKAERDRRHS